MLKFGISLLGLLLVNSALALVTAKDLAKQGVLYYARTEVFETPYVALVQFAQGEHVIQVESEGKKLFEARTSPISEAFKKIEFKSFDGGANVHALILKQKGVHGESLQIVSLKEGKEVFFSTSAWPLSYEVGEDKVTITVADEAGKSEAKFWKFK